MITADKCVCELLDYLRQAFNDEGYGEDELHFYQYEDKPKSWKGAYIAVNALPFVFGYALNDRNILNLNVHVPNLANGSYYRAKARKWLEFVEKYIPVESAYEEGDALLLESGYYCIANMSQPRKDIDNTHYVNYQIKLITINK